MLSIARFEPWHSHPHIIASTSVEKNKDSNCNESLKFPPDFTPSVEKEVGCNMDKQELNCDNLNGGASNQGDHVNAGIDNSYSKREGTESVGSGRFKKEDALRTGGSILTVMDELIKVGQTMGFKMDGCMKNIEEIIESKGVNEMLWEYLMHVMASWKGDVIIMGDFNEVRYSNQRFGSNFNVKEVNAFNSFIIQAGLEEIPLGGCSFTWCHKSGSKMSKLDRFFVSESLLSVCPTLSSITLDRFLSDHRPILLRESTYDYGPSPFRFFKYWAEVDGFEKLIVETWSDNAAYGSNDMLNLMYKLKNLKKKIRGWNRNASEEVIYKRLEIVNSINELEKQQAMETAQKAKIKWVIEAGKWIKNPEMVKKEFLNHFKNRFSRPNKTRLVLVTEFPRQLNSIQRMDMEADLTIEEIKNAVWDCGTDKSPGSDEFSFDFYRRFWSVIQKDVVAAVKSNRLVTVLGDVINEIQSAFVADRQILDGPFILNEVLQWCKLKKKQSFIFKTDFEKAYESVRWDYLEDVLKKLGFGENWCKWIRIVLNSSMVLSHMFFADDAVFVGQWSNSNIDTIIYALKCFERASGLRMNMSKSKIIGIAVNGDKVDQVAHRIGCGILEVPFTYLGSKVGDDRPSMERLFDDVMLRTFYWIRYRFYGNDSNRIGHIDTAKQCGMEKLLKVKDTQHRHRSLRKVSIWKMLDHLLMRIIEEGATMTRAFSLKLEVCSRVPRTGMDEVGTSYCIYSIRHHKNLKRILCTLCWRPPEKIVTCGSHPLESSFHTVLGRGHMGSHIYDFLAVVAHTYVLQQGGPGRTAYNYCCYKYWCP
nr:hypothetical protein [Tanacetum cinerariifolium]